MKTIKSLAKFGAMAVLAAAAVTAVAAPANAGVAVGIGIGVPGPAPVYHPYPGGRWCYWHPGACGYYGPRPGPVFVPVAGTFYAGRGWWDGRGWYRDRFWWGGHWHYR